MTQLPSTMVATVEFTDRVRTLTAQPIKEVQLGNFV